MSGQGFEVVRYFTQVEVTAGKANNLPGVLINIVDANGQPTGVVYEGQTGSPSTISTAATALVLASTGTPAMDGVGALGIATTAPHSDHVHPSDTAKAASVHFHAESDVTNLGTDLTARELTANKNIANGYAGLDATAKVPMANINTDTSREAVANKVTAFSAPTDTQYPSAKLTNDQLALKQPTLVSGTNIKTVNGVTLLGAGDVPSIITNTAIPTLSGYGSVLTANTVLATTAWNKQIPVDATAGNVNIYLPTAVGNTGNAIKVIRLDTSVNTVTVFSMEGIGGIQNNAIAVNLKGVGSVTVKSNGTQPILSAWELPSSVSRLWLPTDATAGSPAVWFSFRDLANMTLNVAQVSAMNNKGTLAGFNLAQATVANQPTLDSATNPKYATFAGAQVLQNAVAQALVGGGGTVVSYALMYQMTSAANATAMGQDNGIQRIQMHPQWSDGNTYADMGDTSTHRWFSALGATVIGANPHTLISVANGANGNTYVDGNPTAAMSSTTLSGLIPTSTAFMRIGADTGGNNFTGRVYEGLLYNVALSTADSQKLAAYMAWGSGQQSIINAGNANASVPPLVSLATY